MKLEELTEIDIVWENETTTTIIDGVEYSLTFESVEDGVKQLNIQTKPSIIKGVVGAATEFASKHPFITGVAALWAYNAVKKYTQNKKYTTRFFAKTTEDKRLYDKIVSDLMKTGHYKLVSSKYVDGGKIWELQRKNV